MKSYTARQICNIVGITYKQLDYWDKKKLLSPSIAKAKGSGSIRLYSLIDIREIKVIKELKQMGISLQKIRTCLCTLKEFFPELKYPLVEKQPFTDGNTVYIFTENPEINIDILLKKGQLVFFVPLRPWMEQIKELIKEFDKKRKKEEEEQEKFYQWAENLAKKKRLTPMSPEEIALLIKQDKVQVIT
ncbi:MAG: MerR family transcriptional regulator [Candidatus Eremiobacterota bacterium]